MRILNKGTIPDSREAVLRIIRSAKNMPGKIHMMKHSTNLIVRKYSHGLPTWGIAWTKGHLRCRCRWAAIVQDPVYPTFFHLILSSKLGGFMNHGWQKRIHMPTGSRALMRFIDDARRHVLKQ